MHCNLILLNLIWVFSLLFKPQNQIDAIYTTTQVPSIDPENQTYSQENLSRLLPSLVIIPKFVESSPGDTIQFVCITKDLDPDPESETIQWTFQHIKTRSQLRKGPVLTEPVDSTMPMNVSISGNVLVVWSVTHEHTGIYRCTSTLEQFDLVAQATSELALKPTLDIAPHVTVDPELIRLSPNSSAIIQCQASGYPAPKLTWHKLENGDTPVRIFGSDQEKTEFSSDISPSMSLESIKIEHLPYSDAMLYCEDRQTPCTNSDRVTAISSLKILHSQAVHQGQYVCLAKNSLGSSQASSLIDVEIGEQPHVSIPDDNREQTVELNGREIAKVIFKCNIESGKPYPKVRWFRPSSNLGSNKNNINMLGPLNENLYDLSQMSSVTSNVTNWLDDERKTLYLSISTNSVNDQGEYVCLAENDWGRYSAVARLHIKKPVSIRITQSSPYVARVNESFHLDCLASGYPLPLDIEWSRYEKGAFFSLISRYQSANLDDSQERALLKFDRISPEESGEYTCNARDPNDPSAILRDTIMVLVEDKSKQEGKDKTASTSSLLPRLMIRPTKITAMVGSNVTLDCLAVSGLQPTVVEWIASSSMAQDNAIPLDSMQIRPYYRTSGGPDRATSSKLFQFGSKLRVLNVTKAHEGVYQCKGRNKIGVEIAPALIRVVDRQDGSESTGLSAQTSNDVLNTNSQANQRKTKVAKTGSNIELKCQVHGVDQPVTSWSRDGMELPKSSVQIDHNLWIRNVSQQDNGLYICSARSKIPNRVIQAKINLVVQGQPDVEKLPELSAKIVASKSVINLGDSLTMECILSNPTGRNSSSNRGPSIMRNDEELAEMEKEVVWTNLHSGQSVFQDNVYIQNNLLIIYELRPENSATYRCNYNELSQHIDFRLIVPGSELMSVDHLADNHADGNANIQDIPSQIVQVPLGGQLQLSCFEEVTTTSGQQPGEYYWTRGHESAGGNLEQLGQPSEPLVIDGMTSDQSNWYQCRAGGSSILRNMLVQVTTPVARFTQKPVSFISLPTISGADHQLSLELKFLPERDHGLILFNGQQQLQQQPQQSSGAWTSEGSIPVNYTNSSYDNSSSNKSQSSSMVSQTASGDYILLGLNRGFVEFRFELGDGVTLLRSQQPVSLNQWHRVVIERNRQGAIMWIDRQAPVRNSSSGKFFNLNLDSVLYVGGSQYFLHKQATMTPSQISTNSSGSLVGRDQLKKQQQQQKSMTNGTNTTSGGGGGIRFFGYTRGFEGCIAQLKISRNEVNLMARNRILSVGIYECDKPECPAGYCGKQGFCQVDRAYRANKSLSASQFVSPDSDLRCLCRAGFVGEKCNQTARASSNSIEEDQHHHQGKSKIDLQSSSNSTPDLASHQIGRSQYSQNQHGGGALDINGLILGTSSHLTTTTASSSNNAMIQDGTCERRPRPCQSNGTVQCESLTKISFRCHCQLGFMGKTCSQEAKFGQAEKAVWFNEQAYLRLHFNQAEEVQEYLRREAVTLARQLVVTPSELGTTNGSDGSFNDKIDSANSDQQHQYKSGTKLDQSTTTDSSNTMIGATEPGGTIPGYHSANSDIGLLTAAAADGLIGQSGTAGGAGSGSAEKSFNVTSFLQLTSMADQQNISFYINTSSKYGLLFYVGQSLEAAPLATLKTGDNQRAMASALTSSAKNLSPSELGLSGSQSTSWDNSMRRSLGPVRSKSVVANLLSRLSYKSNADYLALALVDGHVELSFELGSGIAIIRSSKRVNDGQWHLIQASRAGNAGQLILDEIHKQSGFSPGKLSVLNSQSTDFYVGGLPNFSSEQSTSNNVYVSGFMGCISHLQINSLGPLNLIQPDLMIQIKGARNVEPCRKESAAMADMNSTSKQQQQNPTSTTGLPSVRKPYVPKPELDDADEL